MTTSGTTIGVLGGAWRGRVTPWGDVVGPDGAAVAWYVAADDRWHRPGEEAAVRQVTLQGAPVVETRVRIPGGDAVQRVWAVADAGGLTVIELENDSPMPIAVALTGGGLLTGRPPAALPPQGIDLPASSVVLPVGHRATVRAALPHAPAGVMGPGGRRGGASDGGAGNSGIGDSGVGDGGIGDGGVGGRERSDADRLADARLLVNLPGAEQVAAGWAAHSARASRIDVPDPGAADRLVGARAALALDGPDSSDDAALLLGAGELVRTGEAGAPWVLDVVDAVQRLLRPARRRRTGLGRKPAGQGVGVSGSAGRTSSLAAPLWAAASVLAAAGEERAADDTVAAIARLAATGDRAGGARRGADRRGDGPRGDRQRGDGPRGDGRRDGAQRGDGHGGGQRGDRHGEGERRPGTGPDRVGLAGPVGLDAVDSRAGEALGDDPAWLVHSIEARLALPVAAGACALFPDGIPAAWWGQQFEAHGLRAGPRHRLSFAVRWHGERPALLWEVDGPGPFTLTGGAHDPAWRTAELRGETLLAAP